MQQPDPKKLSKILNDAKKSFNSFTSSMDDMTSKINRGQEALNKDLADSEATVESMEIDAINSLQSTLVDK